MPKVLDQPEVRSQVFPISVDAYHRMIEEGWFDSAKVELIQGILIRKMSKSKLHIHMVKVLFRLLMQAVDPEKYEVQKEDPLTLEHSEPEPDLSVILLRDRPGIPDKPTSAELVIEVAITSLDLDQGKAEDYARAAVPEYWIVRPSDGKTEVYLDPVDNEYRQHQIFGADDAITSRAVPGLVFKMADYL